MQALIPGAARESAPAPQSNTKIHLLDRWTAHLASIRFPLLPPNKALKLCWEDGYKAIRASYIDIAKTEFPELAVYSALQAYAKKHRLPGVMTENSPFGILYRDISRAMEGCLGFPLRKEFDHMAKTASIKNKSINQVLSEMELTKRLPPINGWIKPIVTSGSDIIKEGDRLVERLVDNGVVREWYTVTPEWPVHDGYCFVGEGAAFYSRGIDVCAGEKRVIYYVYDLRLKSKRVGIQIPKRILTGLQYDKSLKAVSGRSIDEGTERDRHTDKPLNPQESDYVWIDGQKVESILRAREICLTRRILFYNVYSHRKEWIGLHVPLVVKDETELSKEPILPAPARVIGQPPILKSSTAQSANPARRPLPKAGASRTASLPSARTTAIQVPRKGTVRKVRVIPKSTEETLRRRTRRCIIGVLPFIPVTDVDQIFNRAFAKQSNRIGRQHTVLLPERCRIAILAHIRHTYTPYDNQCRIVRQKLDAEVSAGVRNPGGGPGLYVETQRRARDVVKDLVEAKWAEWSGRQGVKPFVKIHGTKETTIQFVKLGKRIEMANAGIVDKPIELSDDEELRDGDSESEWEVEEGSKEAPIEFSEDEIVFPRRQEKRDELKTEYVPHERRRVELEAEIKEGHNRPFGKPAPTSIGSKMRPLRKQIDGRIAARNDLLVSSAERSKAKTADFERLDIMLPSPIDNFGRKQDTPMMFPSHSAIDKLGSRSGANPPSMALGCAPPLQSLDSKEKISLTANQNCKSKGGDKVFTQSVRTNPQVPPLSFKLKATRDANFQPIKLTLKSLPFGFFRSRQRCAGSRSPTHAPRNPFSHTGIGTSRLNPKSDRSTSAPAPRPPIEGSSLPRLDRFQGFTGQSGFGGIATPLIHKSCPKPPQQTQKVGNISVPAPDRADKTWLHTNDDTGTVDKPIELDSDDDSFDPLGNMEWEGCTYRIPQRRGRTSEKTIELNSDSDEDMSSPVSSVAAGSPSNLCDPKIAILSANKPEDNNLEWGSYSGRIVERRSETEEKIQQRFQTRADPAVEQVEEVEDADDMELDSDLENDKGMKKMGGINGGGLKRKREEEFEESYWDNHSRNVEMGSFGMFREMSMRKRENEKRNLVVDLTDS